MSDDEQAPAAWFTDAQRKQERGLVVGARVVVRLNGECEHHEETGHRRAELYAMHKPVGVIHSIASNQYEQRYIETGHVYWLTHDYVEIPERPGSCFYGGWFTAAELELLDQPAPRETGE